MALYDTIQQVFDKVWDHFVVNKGTQSKIDSCCQYRGPDGARCAVGVCLPDDLYDAGMEGHRIGFIQINFADVYDKVFNGISSEDLSGLQHAHDAWGVDPLTDESFAEHIERHLRSYASTHNLTIPEGATTDG